MAFMNRDLSVLAYANAFTLWHYRNSTDTLETIIGKAGYFDKIWTLAHTGDIIIINGSDDTAIVKMIVEKESVILEKL